MIEDQSMEGAWGDIVFLGAYEPEFGVSAREVSSIFGSLCPSRRGWSPINTTLVTGKYETLNFAVISLKSSVSWSSSGAVDTKSSFYAWTTVILSCFTAGARRAMTLSMITANATDDGAPIYLRADGSWSRALSEGRAGESEQLAAALALAKTQQRIVCDPYLIDVKLVEGRPTPTNVRERIRAHGPTVLLPVARAVAA